jgi:phosphonate degradation associated HDIG domain protein
MVVVASIVGLFESVGRERYLDEGVSQREHALQAAALAEAEGAAPTLVVTALLHDIGHLLARERDGDDVRQKAALPHEQIGASWLEPLFGPAITEPVRLHVEAKRYLCAVEPGYSRQLSEASLQRLGMQGGAMGRSEIRDFQEHPYHRAAVWLRRIDDRARHAGRTDVPGFEHYRERLETALLSRALALETARRRDAYVARGYCQPC